MSIFSLRLVRIGLGVLILVVAVVTLGAWFLNSANAALARAYAIPVDAPGRNAWFDKAEANLQIARVFPANSRIALVTARLALGRGDPASALETLSDESTDDVMLQWTLGNAAWQLDQRDLAYAHWRAAGALDYFTQQMYRASFRHRWSEAEYYAHIALGIEANDAAVHYILADALAYQSIDDPAILPELERAASQTSDPEFLSTIYSRHAEVLAGRAEYRQALEMFQLARATAPADARPRTGYALTLLKIQPAAYDESVDLLSQVVADSPWYVAAYIALADLANAHGDAASAENWLRQGLARNPNNVSVLVALAKFCAAQNRLDEAKNILETASKLATLPDDSQTIMQMLTALGAQ